MQRESQAQIFTNLANSRIRDLHDELVRGKSEGCPAMWGAWPPEPQNYRTPKLTVTVAVGCCWGGGAWGVIK